MEEIKMWYSDISYSELKDFIKESILGVVESEEDDGTD